jgi:hypothetical protein
MKVNDSVISNAVENLFSLWSIAVAAHDEGESQRDELLGAIRAVVDSNPKTVDRIAESIRLFGSGRVAAGEKMVEGIIPAELRARVDEYVAEIESTTETTFDKDMLRRGRASINTDVAACRRILGALCHDATYTLKPTFYASLSTAPTTKESNRKGKTKAAKTAQPPAGSKVGEFEKYVREVGSKGDAELLAVLRAAHLLLQAKKDSIGAMALAEIERRYKAAA